MSARAAVLRFTRRPRAWLRVAGVLAWLSAGAAAISSSFDCLPAPPPKAYVDVTIVGGPASFDTSDGATIRFDRRVVVLSVGTASSDGSAQNAHDVVRDLDAEPFLISPALRAADQRLVTVGTHPYYDVSVGPGVTSADIAELQGESTNDNLRTGASSFLISVVVMRDGKTWTLHWHRSLFGELACGHSTTTGTPAPLTFDPSSQHTMAVTIHFEELFSSPTNPGVLLAQPLIDADQDGDGRISSTESLALALQGFAFSFHAIDVVLDGEELACDVPGPVAGSAVVE